MPCPWLNFAPSWSLFRNIFWRPLNTPNITVMSPFQMSDPAGTWYYTYSHCYSIDIFFNSGVGITYWGLISHFTKCSLDPVYAYWPGWIMYASGWMLWWTRLHNLSSIPLVKIHSLCIDVWLQCSSQHLSCLFFVDTWCLQFRTAAEQCLCRFRKVFERSNHAYQWIGIVFKGQNALSRWFITWRNTCQIERVGIFHAPWAPDFVVLFIHHPRDDNWCHICSAIVSRRPCILWFRGIRLSDLVPGFLSNPLGAIYLACLLWMRQQSIFCNCRGTGLSSCTAWGVRLETKLE